MRLAHQGCVNGASEYADLNETSVYRLTGGRLDWLSVGAARFVQPETRLRILFLHQNAPGQFRHLAPHLAAHPGNQVVVLGERTHPVPGVIRWLRYGAPAPAGAGTHRYLHRIEASVRRGQQVVRACAVLRDEGFVPDVVIAHSGWGETMFLRDILPRVAILTYCEMFYRSTGQDAGYIPETAIDLDGACRLRAWNADLLTALDTMDRGLSPTAWQRAQHPAAYLPRIAVVHDGVDMAAVAPDAAGRFTLGDGRILMAGDEVVTFVARNLEPIRGFVPFMRALPELLRRRPRAQVIICGDDRVSYGRAAPGGRSWRETMSAEVPLDPARVHFVGRLNRRDYLSLLQVSALHVYLTVPFVLSWSCVEALAAGCLVLGSDVPPVREAITDGVNGFLVDMRDPWAIADRATELLARRASLGEIRAEARRSARERYDLHECLAAQSRLVRSMAA